MLLTIFFIINIYWGNLSPDQFLSLTYLVSITYLFSSIWQNPRSTLLSATSAYGIFSWTDSILSFSAQPWLLPPTRALPEMIGETHHFSRSNPVPALNFVPVRQKCPNEMHKCPNFFRAFCQCFLCFHIYSCFERIFLTSFFAVSLAGPSRRHW